MKTALAQQLLSGIQASLDSTEKTATYSQMMAEHVKTVFNKLDTDGTGEISVEEFPALMKGVVGLNMSKNEASAIVRIIDKDGSGTVDFGDFLDWWREHALVSGLNRIALLVMLVVLLVHA